MRPISSARTCAHAKRAQDSLTWARASVSLASLRHRCQRFHHFSISFFTPTEIKSNKSIIWYPANNRLSISDCRSVSDRRSTLMTVSTTLSVAVYVHVSGRIRVRDSARYLCCYHVSVGDRARDPCGVLRVYVDEFDRVCDRACFNSGFHVSVSDLVRDRVSVRVHVQCPWPFRFSVRVHVWAVSEGQQSCPCLFPCSCSCQWVCWSASLLVAMSVSVSESMTVTEFVFVTLSVISCPFPLSFQTRPVPRLGRDHKFERATVRVAACTFSVAVFMHNQVSVRLSVSV